MVSDVHTGANNIVPDVRCDVSNAHVIVSEIRRSTLKSREDAGDQNIAVSIACTLLVTKRPVYSCLDSRQVRSQL